MNYAALVVILLICLVFQLLSFIFNVVNNYFLLKGIQARNGSTDNSYLLNALSASRTTQCLHEDLLAAITKPPPSSVPVKNLSQNGVENYAKADENDYEELGGYMRPAREPPSIYKNGQF